MKMKDVTKEELMKDTPLMYVLSVMITYCKKKGLKHLIVGVDIEEDGAVIKIDDETTLEEFDNQ